MNSAAFLFVGGCAIPVLSVAGVPMLAHLGGSLPEALQGTPMHSSPSRETGLLPNSSTPLSRPPEGPQVPACTCQPLAENWACGGRGLARWQKSSHFLRQSFTHARILALPNGQVPIHSLSVCLSPPPPAPLSSFIVTPPTP